MSSTQSHSKRRHRSSSTSALTTLPALASAPLAPQAEALGPIAKGSGSSNREASAALPVRAFRKATDALSRIMPRRRAESTQRLPPLEGESASSFEPAPRRLPPLGGNGTPSASSKFAAPSERRRKASAAIDVPALRPSCPWSTKSDLPAVRTASPLKELRPELPPLGRDLRPSLPWTDLVAIAKAPLAQQEESGVAECLPELAEKGASPSQCSNREATHQSPNSCAGPLGADALVIGSPSCGTVAVDADAGELESPVAPSRESSKARRADLPELTGSPYMEWPPSEETTERYYGAALKGIDITSDEMSTGSTGASSCAASDSLAAELAQLNSAVAKDLEAACEAFRIDLSPVASGDASTERPEAAVGDRSVVKKQVQEEFLMQRDLGKSPTEAAVEALRHCAKLARSGMRTGFGLVATEPESYDALAEMISPAARTVMSC